MARITIAMNFYNGAATMAAAIKSVFAQTFQDWELLLLDDGSTDGSLQIAQSVKDPRVKVISDGVNKGIGDRRREIVDMVETEYLAWLDADDLMHPDRLAVQYEFLESHPEVDIADSFSWLMDSEFRVTSMVKQAKAAFTIDDAVNNSIMLTPATLGRISMFRKFPFDPDFPRSEDWELYIRAIAGGAVFARIPQPLYFYCSSDATGTILWKKAWRFLPVVRRIVLKHGPSNVGWPKTLAILANHHARGIIRCALCASGLQRLLPRTRTQAVTQAEIAEAQAVVEKVFRTVVPGMDDAVMPRVGAPRYP